MKVKLAAQVFSKPVADALELLHSDVGELRQIGNEATVHFIRVVDHLFDCLILILHLEKDQKVRLGNIGHCKQMLITFRDYFSTLKSGDGI